MLQGWIIVAIALAYIGFLFLVASYGDRMRKLSRGSSLRLLIYPLSLAIYCTSWSFFGSVGLASSGGFDFLGSRGRFNAPQSSDISTHGPRLGLAHPLARGARPRRQDLGS